jgi:hypothetical protein
VFFVLWDRKFESGEKGGKKEVRGGRKETRGGWRLRTLTNSGGKSCWKELNNLCVPEVMFGLAESSSNGNSSRLMELDWSEATNE